MSLSCFFVFFLQLLALHLHDLLFKRTMADLSYLVMTAADCASYNEEHPHNIVSLNQMLEVRAKEQPDTICVGFTTRSSSDDVFGCDTLSMITSDRCFGCQTKSPLTKLLDSPLPSSFMYFQLSYNFSKQSARPLPISPIL
jgi:hypothetical protein